MCEVLLVIAFRAVRCDNAVVIAFHVWLGVGALFFDSAGNSVVGGLYRGTGCA